MGLGDLAGRSACEVALQAEFVPCPAADAHAKKTPLQTSKFGGECLQFVLLPFLAGYKDRRVILKADF